MRDLSIEKAIRDNCFETIHLSIPYKSLGADREIKLNISYPLVDYCTNMFIHIDSPMTEIGDIFYLT